ncbi:MarR family transcriptional regulator [Streptomyces sp. CB03911]|uniref:MarR family winged helix-turn-helix transcriptional regulator n=1 Tax=Streptomyces sp. CB03911 TaxID=1804758 RepID=UPI00257100DD|nr:MarR family transcriptional regulator [Streptomyces sp. CB03911]
MGTASKLTEAVGWRLGAAVKRAEHALMAEKSRVLRPFELTVPQYAALLALSLTPEISGARLARLCLVTPQSMTTVLKTLETRGLIERRPSPDHAQVLITRLSPEGAALLARADAAAAAVERRLADSYTPEERETLRRLLDRATDVLGG